MKAQIYNFETLFDFGKHRGKSLKYILESRVEKYIGYLLAEDMGQSQDL